MMVSHDMTGSRARGWEEEMERELRNSRATVARQQAEIALLRQRLAELETMRAAETAGAAKGGIGEGVDWVAEQSNDE